jgi:hypothetical protein
MFAFCFFAAHPSFADPRFLNREPRNVRFRPQAHPGHAAHAVPADRSLRSCCSAWKATTACRRRDPPSPRWTATTSRSRNGTRSTSPRSTSCASRCPPSTPSCSTRRPRATPPWSAWCVTACSAPPPSKARLMASDQRLARELQSNEVIASLRGKDGKLDMERYKQLLARRACRRSSSRNRCARPRLAPGAGRRGRLRLRCARAGQRVARRFFDKREVQVARFEPADYAAKVNPTPADLEAFYKDNPQLFQAPEQASIEYVVLDLETREEGHRRQRAGPQDLLRAERRPPGRPGRAPCQPHPGRRAQGRVGRRQGQGSRACTGTGRSRPQGAAKRSPTSRRRTRRTRCPRPTAATSTAQHRGGGESARTRWSPAASRSTRRRARAPSRK